VTRRVLGRVEVLVVDSVGGVDRVVVVAVHRRCRGTRSLIVENH